MTALASASTNGSTAPAAKTSKVVAIAATAVPLFSNYTLGSAVDLLACTEWTQGVDEMSAIADLTRSLEADFALIDMQVRDDDFIRGRASAALRRLSVKFQRADAHDLVSYEDVSMTALSRPDAFQAQHG